MQEEKKEQYMTVPNMITALRILGTAALFAVKPLSIEFYILYTFCGITDVLDGVVARATNTMTEFGSRLDSIADLLFYSVMILRIFPVLWDMLPKNFWFGVAAIVVMRLITYGLAACKYRRFASMHTYMNKVTGFFVFAVPYFLTWIHGVLYCKIVCLVAGISTVEEFLIHCFSKKYREENKSLLKVLQQN